MIGREEQMQAAAIEQAGEWYARHRDGKLTPAETQAFMAWLQASPLHVREYLAAAELSAHLPAAAGGLDTDREALIAQARQALHSPDNIVSFRPAAFTPDEQPRPATRARLAAAFAAVLVLGVAGGLYWGLGGPGFSSTQQALEIPRGEQRTVQLSDGSVLHLNAETRVRVRYSSKQRLIELDHGQALFNAAKDPLRPFTVRAGETDVVAVGTQFDVLKRDGQGPLTVTVVEGKVDVRDAHEVGKRVRVSAGQRLRVNPAVAAGAAVPEPVDVHTATAWLRRELMFSEQPLSEVAEEFSRYGTPIVIDTPALREYRVSGVFSAYDTESFVTFLKRIGEVEQTPDGIRVR